MSTLKIIKKEYRRIGYEKNDVEPMEYLEVSAQYDGHNQLVREERFEPDGTLNTLTLNEYNDRHQLVLSEQFDQDNTLLQKTVNTYQDDRLATQCFFFGEDTTEYVTKHIYDDLGNEIRRENYVDGKLDYVENIKVYDGSLLKKETENDDYGKPLYEHLYDYNEQGWVIRHVRNEIQNKDRRTYDYEYNDQGQCIKELIYDYDDMLIAKKYNTYDTEGHLVMVEEEDLDNYRKVKLEYEGNLVVKNYLYERDDKLTGWAEYGYDENGKEVSATEYIRDEVDPETHRLLRVTHFERA
ncbi:MAG: hypothetical protein J6T86_08605 [Bacteroidales bacterium]|nr:hypothetical protein [Bacteroidales bacterium]